MRRTNHTLSASSSSSSELEEEEDDEQSTYDSEEEPRQNANSEISADEASESSSASEEAAPPSVVVDKTQNYAPLPPDLSSFCFDVFRLEARDPDTIFALSYDVALFVGLRDSFALFNKYPALTRLWTSAEEREHLASIGALSANVKRRNIAIVDVRQVLSVITKKSCLKSVHLRGQSSASHASATGEDPTIDENFVRNRKARKRDGAAASGSVPMLTPGEMAVELNRRLSPHNQAEFLASHHAQSPLAMSILFAAERFNADIAIRKRRLLSNFPLTVLSNESARATDPKFIHVKSMSLDERRALNDELHASNLIEACSASHYAHNSLQANASPDSANYPLALLKGQYSTYASCALPNLHIQSKINRLIR